MMDIFNVVFRLFGITIPSLQVIEGPNLAPMPQGDFLLVTVNGIEEIGTNVELPFVNSGNIDGLRYANLVASVELRLYGPNCLANSKNIIFAINSEPGIDLLYKDGLTLVKIQDIRRIESDLSVAEIQQSFISEFEARWIEKVVRNEVDFIESTSAMEI